MYKIAIFFLWIIGASHIKKKKHNVLSQVVLQMKYLKNSHLLLPRYRPVLFISQFILIRVVFSKYLVAKS